MLGVPCPHKRWPKRMTLPKSQVLEMWPNKGHSRQLHSRGNWEKQVVTRDTDPFSLSGPRPAYSWQELRMLPAPPASHIPWSQQPQSAVPAAFLHSIRAILMLSVQAVVSPAVQFPRTTVKTCWWLRETRLDSAGFKTTPRAAQILTGGSGSPTMIPDQRARTRRERRRRPGPGQPTSQAEGVGLGLREQLR